MLIRNRPGWAMAEDKATDEHHYLNRRQLITAMGLAAGGLMGSAAIPTAWLGGQASAAVSGLPGERNPAFTLDRDITREDLATTYTNFYEFGSSKNIWKAAQKLETDPWAVTVDGMVERPMTIEADALMTKLGGLEERLYRHRCVEAWAMAVPWNGVPMSRLLDLVKPDIGAKYVRLETFHDPDIAPGQRQRWYPWPYVEGVTLQEAGNILALLTVGIYGKPLPNQNGAPLRLVLPWKYGFKGIKSIRRIHFTDKRPVSFWEQLQPREYGFWANVNPAYDHPRWSQATERLLGSDARVPTLRYNGYEEWVAPLYADMLKGSPKQDRVLFF